MGGWRVKVSFHGWDDTFYLKVQQPPEEILKIFEARKPLFGPFYEWCHTELLLVLMKAHAEGKLRLHDYMGIHSFPVGIPNAEGTNDYGGVDIDHFTFSDPPLVGL